jgi:hypothetical protein
VLAVERGLSRLQTLAGPAGVSTADWQRRELAVNKMLLRPCRTYRQQLLQSVQHSRLKTQQVLQRSAASTAAAGDRPVSEPPAGR